jgi:hypothetical protein
MIRLLEQNVDTEVKSKQATGQSALLLAGSKANFIQLA